MNTRLDRFSTTQQGTHTAPTKRYTHAHHNYFEPSYRYCYKRLQLSCSEPSTSCLYASLRQTYMKQSLHAVALLYKKSIQQNGCRGTERQGSALQVTAFDWRIRAEWHGFVHFATCSPFKWGATQIVAQRTLQVSAGSIQNIYRNFMSHHFSLFSSSRLNPKETFFTGQFTINKLFSKSCLTVSRC